MLRFHLTETEECVDCIGTGYTEGNTDNPYDLRPCNTCNRKGYIVIRKLINADSITAIKEIITNFY